MLEAFSEYDKLSAEVLHAKLFEIEDYMSQLDFLIQEEDAKFQRYKVLK